MDVIESLKKSNILKDQKIVIFTASSATDNEISELIQNEGISFCIRKPVDIKFLIKKIEDMAKSQ
jgi:CheY-like chemotaxis protein